MSRLSKITDEELSNMYFESSSVSELLRNLGYTVHGDSRKTLKRKLTEIGLSFQDLVQKGKKISSSKLSVNSFTYNDDEIFVERSKVSRGVLRRAALRNSTIEHACGFCGLGEEWRGEPITLQLHHVNGVGDDNRVENLMYLCPNCHSQTLNYGSKNRKVL